MSTDKIKTTRTVAIVGHGGGGKTSLAEAMLFNAKATDRFGQGRRGQPPPWTGSLKKPSGVAASAPPLATTASTSSP